MENEVVVNDNVFCIYKWTVKKNNNNEKTSGQGPKYMRKGKTKRHW